MNSQSLSAFFGSISLFIWIVVFTPQIVNNWRYKNASSVSLAFIAIWLTANVFSVIGAIIGKLLMTTIVLTSYLIIADVVIIFQIFHYKPKKEMVLDWKSHHETSIPELTSQLNPLLDNKIYQSYTYSRPVSLASHRISIVNPNRVSTVTWRDYNASKHKRMSTISTASYPPAEEIPSPEKQIGVVTILAGLCLVVLVVILIYFNKQTIVANPASPHVFGWLSAFLSNFARIPQLKMNYERKSVEGLSLLMFVLSLVGNITFELSIMLFSTEPSYLTKNLPWIFGTGLLCLFDSAILAQFYLYWNNVIYFEIEEQDNTEPQSSSIFQN